MFMADYPALVASLDDAQLEALKEAMLVEEAHREAVRATMEAEYEKEARAAEREWEERT